MKFPAPLMRGRLIKRYKRFLADIELADPVLEKGSALITAHCANPGSMMGLNAPGSEVWLSRATNPKAKLRHKWELVRAGDSLVGINTHYANTVAHEAISQGIIRELTGYSELKREVKYGANSRIDLLLEDKNNRPPCYVEVKSVTLCRDNSAGGRDNGAGGRDNGAAGRRLAEFPDSVTTRGAKHLNELKAMVDQGARAMMLFIVQRGDCDHFSVASDIDQVYARCLQEALNAGVEAVCYDTKITTEEITVNRPLPIML
jgi:sugar fermentation stimulation protein A